MLQTASWAALAAIHALPALAFFRPATITSLYGIDPASPVFLLMQHRAALFLGVFVLCCWSLFDPQPRKAASVLTAISMLAFLLLYLLGDSPRSLRTIALADLAGLPLLAYVTWKAFSQ